MTILSDEPEKLGGRRALARPARRKRARALMARPHVETIKDAEVCVADDFQTPEKRQAQCPADSARDFHEQLATAQGHDLNLHRCFFFARFHYHLH